MTVLTTGCVRQHRTAIRQRLERTGWAEQHVAGAERNAEAFAQDGVTYQKVFADS